MALWSPSDAAVGLLRRTGRPSQPGITAISISSWNRIGMTDSNFALDEGESRAEDSA
jgi:hypothetical protein